MDYLTSDVIQLRALEPEDLPLLYKWENNTQWWEDGNTLTPYSSYILREYIVNSDKSIYETKQLRLMISLASTADTVGMIDLYDFDPHHSRAGVGIMIDPSFQQKGYAAEALRLLTEYAFNFFSVNQLYAHITTENTASIKLFEATGFVQAGVLKQWIKGKKSYKDIFVYQKINQEEAIV